MDVEEIQNKGFTMKYNISMYKKMMPQETNRRYRGATQGYKEQRCV